MTKIRDWFPNLTNTSKFTRQEIIFSFIVIFLFIAGLGNIIYNLVKGC